MNGHEHLAEWDAAFVLGALTPADRRVYEDHLESCERCRITVAELGPMPGLLAQIRPEPAKSTVCATESPVPAPRRWSRGRALAWVAAASAVATLLVPLSFVLLRPPAPEGITVALEPVGSTSMRVAVELVPEDWGTRVSITCDYPATWDYQYQQARYSLVVTEADGTATQVTSWRSVAGTVELAATTAVDLDAMASLAVVSATGEEVLATALLSPEH